MNNEQMNKKNLFDILDSDAVPVTKIYDNLKSTMIEKASVTTTNEDDDYIDSRFFGVSSEERDLMLKIKEEERELEIIQNRKKQYENQLREIKDKEYDGKILEQKKQMAETLKRFQNMSKKNQYTLYSTLSHFCEILCDRITEDNYCSTDWEWKN